MTCHGSIMTQMSLLCGILLPVSEARVVSYTGVVEELTVTQEAGSSYLW